MMKAWVITAVVILILVLGGIYLLSNSNLNSAASAGSSSSSGSNAVGSKSSGSVGNTATSNSNLKIFNISAKNFRFYMNSVESPELRVNVGDRVRIVFTNEEGFHDWKIDEFNAATKRVNGGQTDTIEFVADKKGTFEYFCSVATHRQMGMRGNLIVQ